MSNWIKTTPYGDYSVGRTTDTATKHIIRQAKALGVCGKHAGSKPISRLLNGIKTIQEATKKF